MIEYNQVKIGQRIKQLRKSNENVTASTGKSWADAYHRQLCAHRKRKHISNITTLLELSNFFNRKVSYLLCEDDSETVTPNSMSL